MKGNHMKLQIQIRPTKPGIVTISPEGSIGANTSSIPDREFCRILAGKIKALVLDMAAEVYQAAMKNEQLPQRDRIGFETMMKRLRQRQNR